MEQDKDEEVYGPDGQKLDPNDPKALIAKASATVDDEYESRKGSDKNYYQIAHTLREPVQEQPKMLAFGKLTEYQVFACALSAYYKCHTISMCVHLWEIVMMDIWSRILFLKRRLPSTGSHPYISCTRTCTYM